MRYVFVLAMISLMPVQAAFAEISWFLGAGGSITKLETSNFVQFSGLDPDPTSPFEIAGSGEFSDKEFGWQVFAGLMFSEHFGLSVKYSESGDASDDWEGFIEQRPDLTDSTTWTRTDYQFTGEASIDGFTVYALQTIPFADNFEFSLELGWTLQDVDFTWNSSINSGSVSDDDSGLAIGGILRYKFLKHWAISAEFEWLNIGFGDLMDEPIRLGINAEFHY